MRKSEFKPVKHIIMLPRDFVFYSLFIATAFTAAGVILGTVLP